MEATASPPIGCNKEVSSPVNIAKAKRTKRLRILSPIPLTVEPPFLEDDTNHLRYPSPSGAVSAASSEESTTTVEEDTARCLILLASGHFSPTKQPRGHQVSIRDINKRNKEAAGGAAGTMYACKTCDRVFSSFQALGGHRASHKKPKNEKKSSSTSFFLSDEEDFPSPSISPYKSRMSLSLQLNSTTNASPRIHECSYCGAEFTSGQALGGHMRRHRASGPISPFSKPPMPTVQSKEIEFEFEIKPKNGFSLDLNLPAPEDEHQRCFGFDSKQQKS